MALARALLPVHLLGGLAATGCRFERRADLTAEGAAVNEDLVTRAGVRTPAEDSVRAVVTAIEEALARGDVSRIANLTVPQTMLIDQEEAVRWYHDDPRAPLPRALWARADPFWTLAASHFVPLGASALLVNEYAAPDTPDAGDEPTWRAAETFVLVRTEAGWRLRHLHRSWGPAGGGPTAP